MNGSDPMPEHDTEIERLRANERPFVDTIKQLTADVERMTDEMERLQAAYNVACQNIVLLNDKCTEFTNALLRGMTLVDELLRENGRLCSASNEPPSVRLFAAKASFDAAMHRLLGSTTTEAKTSLTTSIEGEAK